MAVVVARRIDADQEPGSALASLVKALRDTLRELLADRATEQREPDAVDLMRARLRQRRE